MYFYFSHTYFLMGPNDYLSLLICRCYAMFKSSI